MCNKITTSKLVQHIEDKDQDGITMYTYEDNHCILQENFFFAVHILVHRNVEYLHCWRKDLVRNHKNKYNLVYHLFHFDMLDTSRLRLNKIKEIIILVLQYN